MNDYGSIQSKVLLIHLWAGPLRTAPAEVTQSVGARAVAVQARRFRRWYQLFWLGSFRWAILGGPMYLRVSDVLFCVLTCKGALVRNPFSVLFQVNFRPGVVEVRPTGVRGGPDRFRARGRACSFVSLAPGAT